MRIVKFIQSLNIKDVRLYKYQELKYSTLSMDRLQPISDDEFIDAEADTRVIPVHEFRKNYGRNSDYTEEYFIAFSKEVQDLLEMPFDIMKEQLESAHSELSLLRRQLNSYKNMGILNRLRFFLTKRFKDE